MCKACAIWMHEVTRLVHKAAAARHGGATVALLSTSGAAPAIRTHLYRLEERTSVITSTRHPGTCAAAPAEGHEAIGRGRSLAESRAAWHGTRPGAGS